MPNELKDQVDNQIDMFKMLVIKWNLAPSLNIVNFKPLESSLFHWLWWKAREALDSQTNMLMTKTAQEAQLLLLI